MQDLKKINYYNLVGDVNKNFDTLEDAVQAIEATQVEPAATIAAIPASTNITTVPGSFADASAVQSYLAGANVIPNIESRLDLLELRVNTIIANLKASGAIAE